MWLISLTTHAQPADVDASPPSPTQTPAVAEPVAQPLIVRELSVFVLDRFGTLANNERDYGSTLFNGAYRRRPPETGKPLSTPMPLGLLTFDGPLDVPRHLRLELPGQDDAPQDKGRFLGHWPKTQAQARVLEWHDLRAAGPDERSPTVSAGHWLVPLRQNNARTRLTTRGNTDRFLAYDVSIAMAPPVLIAPGQTNALTLHANTEFGPNAGGEVLVIDQDRIGVAWKWAKVGPEEKITVELGQLKSNGQPLKELDQRLRDRGFNDAEISVALSIVQRLTVEKWGMSAVCILDKPAMDALLPLTIEPPADRVERIGLVVLTNIDPDINHTIDQFIAQLGSDEWAVRNASQIALIDLGRAAIERVQAYRGHADPEVAYRVQQIIEAFELRYQDSDEAAE